MTGAVPKVKGTMPIMQGAMPYNERRNAYKGKALCPFGRYARDGYRRNINCEPQALCEYSVLVQTPCSAADAMTVPRL